MGIFTLQKSMLLTPLLPSAGPTGGLGLACPAPTINFTNWLFLARTLRDMAGCAAVFRIFFPYTKFIGCCINGLKSDSRSAGDEGRGWTEADITHFGFQSRRA